MCSETMSNSVCSLVALTVSVIVLLTGAVAPASAFKLQIHPRHDHYRLKDRVRVMCVADESITSCEFRSLYKSHYDLNAGRLAPPTDTYRYFGNGLENGECGIDLSPYRRFCHDILECRVRTENHGWRYASAMIEVSDEDAKPSYVVSPSHKHVFAGDNITVLGHSVMSVNSCSYKWTESSWIHFDQSSHLELPEEDRNVGKGLENGDCAVILPNVKSGGFVIFLAFRKTIPRDTAMSHMTVTVYKPPEEPELNLSTTTYKAGDLLTATCVVKNSRPVSNISWYFGDELLRNDTLDESADGESRWRWSYDLQTVKQQVTRRLTWQDDGKELVCRAGHLALPNGQLDVKATITVLFTPQQVSRAVEVSGFHAGDQGRITCRYYANPPPVMDWRFEKSMDGSAVAAGRYNFTAISKVGNAWVSTLTIYNITALDNTQGLYVTIHNNQGGVIHYLKINVHDADYLDLIDEYNYGSIEALYTHRTMKITSTNFTLGTPTSSTSSPSPTPTTTASSQSPTTTPTPSSSTTPIPSSTTTSIPSSNTTITTVAEEVEETKNGTATAVGDEKLVTAQESKDSGSKVGLAFGIISLLAIIIAVSFVVYKYTSRRCFGRLPYATFRRSPTEDGEDESFNINADLDEKF